MLNKAKEMTAARKNFRESKKAQLEAAAVVNKERVKEIEKLDEKIRKLNRDMLALLSKGKDLATVQSDIEILQGKIEELKKAIAEESKPVEQAEIDFFTPYVKDVEQEYNEFYNSKVDQLKESEARVREQKKLYNAFIEHEEIKRKAIEKELQEGFLLSVTSVGEILPFDKNGTIRRLDKQIFYNKDLKPLQL